MSIANFVPLTEAAAFTCGCAVLRAQWYNPERVGAVLLIVATLLGAGLLLALTPESVCIDAGMLDPAAIWSLTVDPPSHNR